MPRFAKFRFSVPERLRGKKLYEVLSEIEKMQECSEKGSINPITTNYGCAGFHFCYYDSNKILQYCGDYVSAQEKNRLRMLLEKDSGALLDEEIEGDTLAKIVKDHPDVVAGGLITVVLSMAGLDVKYEEFKLEEAIKSLRWNLQRLENLKDTVEKGRFADYQWDYGYMEFGEDTDYDIEEDTGLTIYLDFDFETDETLEALEKEIDKSIDPLKRYLTRAPRIDLYLSR